MDLKKYEAELHMLYGEFIRIHQKAGGHLPKALPGIPRSHYLECKIDVTDSPDNINREIEEFKSKIFDTRRELFHYYHKERGITAVANLPHRSDGKKSKETPESIIKKTSNALIAYQNKSEHSLEIAKKLGLIDNSYISDQKAKNVERNVRRYLEHAETLLKAIDECTFFEAVKTPFPRNK